MTNKLEDAPGYEPGATAPAPVEASMRNHARNACSPTKLLFAVQSLQLPLVIKKRKSVVISDDMLPSATRADGDKSSAGNSSAESSAGQTSAQSSSFKLSGQGPVHPRRSIVLRATVTASSTDNLTPSPSQLDLAPDFDKTAITSARESEQQTGEISLVVPSHTHDANPNIIVVSPTPPVQPRILSDHGTNVSAPQEHPAENRTSPKTAPKVVPRAPRVASQSEETPLRVCEQEKRPSLPTAAPLDNNTAPSTNSPLSVPRHRHKAESAPPKPITPEPAFKIQLKPTNVASRLLHEESYNDPNQAATASTPTQESPGAQFKIPLKHVSTPAKTSEDDVTSPSSEKPLVSPPVPFPRPQLRHVAPKELKGVTTESSATTPMPLPPSGGPTPAATPMPVSTTPTPVAATPTPSATPYPTANTASPHILRAHAKSEAPPPVASRPSPATRPGLSAAKPSAELVSPAARLHAPDTSVTDMCGHQFQVKTYVAETICVVCQNLMTGVAKQVRFDGALTGHLISHRISSRASAAVYVALTATSNAWQQLHRALQRVRAPRYVASGRLQQTSNATFIPLGLLKNIRKASLSSLALRRVVVAKHKVDNASRIHSSSYSRPGVSGALLDALLDAGQEIVETKVLLLFLELHGTRALGSAICALEPFVRTEAVRSGLYGAKNKLMHGSERIAKHHKQFSRCHPRQTHRASLMDGKQLRSYRCAWACRTHHTYHPTEHEYKIPMHGRNFISHLPQSRTCILATGRTGASRLRHPQRPLPNSVIMSMIDSTNRALTLQRQSQGDTLTDIAVIITLRQSSKNCDVLSCQKYQELGTLVRGSSSNAALSLALAVALLAQLLTLCNLQFFVNYVKTKKDAFYPHLQFLWARLEGRHVPLAPVGPGFAVSPHAALFPSALPCFEWPP